MILYTCIIGQKDALPPVKKEEGVRYVCFSDRKFQHPVWKFRPIDTLGQTDPRRIARRYKILSHIYFPGEDTIWVDGRISLRRSVKELFQDYRGLIHIRRHHARGCIYQEAEEVKRVNYEVHEIVDRQVLYLESRLYPKSNGLHETGILLRRASEEAVRFNNSWWAMVSTFSKRDQLSCDYVAWWEQIKIEEMSRDEAKIGRHQRKTTERT